MMHDYKELHTFFFFIVRYCERRAPLDSMIYVNTCGVYVLRNTDLLKCSIQLGVSEFSSGATLHHAVVFSTN